MLGYQQGIDWKLNIFYGIRKKDILDIKIEFSKSTARLPDGVFSNQKSHFG
jgi:hypothetical protein